MVWQIYNKSALTAKNCTTVACHCHPGDCDVSENAEGLSTPLGEIRIVCIPLENLRTSQAWMKPKKKKHSQLAYINILSLKTYKEHILLYIPVGMFEEEETFPVGKEISTPGFVKLYHM